MLLMVADQGISVGAGCILFFCLFTKKAEFVVEHKIVRLRSDGEVGSVFSASSMLRHASIRFVQIVRFSTCAHFHAHLKLNNTLHAIML